MGILHVKKSSDTESVALRRRRLFFSTYGGEHSPLVLIVALNGVSEEILQLPEFLVEGVINVEAEIEKSKIRE